MLQIPGTEPCSTEQALARSLIAATDRILDLGCLELAATINREPAEKMASIRHDLDRATKCKTLLLDRYDSHVRSHRCKRSQAVMEEENCGPHG